MSPARRAFLVLGLALAFAACGSEEEEGEPIPQNTAAAIESQLDNIQGQLDDGSLGACEDIKEPDGTFQALENAVDRVPGRVDPDVRGALTQSVSRLSELVDEECASLEDTEPAPEPVETIEEEPPPIEEEPPPPPTETVPQEEEDGEELPPGQEKKLEQPNEILPDGGPGNSEGNGGGAPVPGGGE